MTGLLTAEGTRYVRRMLRDVAPCAAELDRSFRRWLLDARFEASQRKDLLAITPAAASRFQSLERFQKQVEASGVRLAKLNVPPDRIADALDSFDRLAGALLEGRFAPAREQFRLATSFVLTQVFYMVREAEAQAFFGLHRAESEAKAPDDLLARFARVLAKAVHAKQGRAVLYPGRLPPDLRRPKCVRGIWSFPFGESAAVQFGFASAVRWLPRDEVLLRAAASRFQEAIERARLSERIRRLQAESRRAEEEERHRIGRELHDEAGQALAYLRLQLEMLERESPTNLQCRMREARELAARTTVELRRIIAALSPSVLERLGLEAALHQLANRFRGIHRAEVRVRVARLLGRLPRRSEEVVYRVAQECLQNAAKHSGATRVNLSLACADKKLRLSVRDNGAGFEAEKALREAGRFGLVGMRDRAMLVGGSLTVRSAPGKGTRVTLELPAPVVGNAQNSRTDN